MPTQRFDGPTLEEALTKVRASVGADARILGAEKVRTGGLGGFFAKERIEVTVETAETPAPAVATAAVPAAVASAADAPAPPRSILDLAESISDVEQGITTVSTESDSFASVLRRIAGEADMAMAAQTALDDPSAATAALHAPVPALAVADTHDEMEAPVAAHAPAPTKRALAAFAALARRSPRSDVEVEAEVEMMTEPVVEMLTEPAGPMVTEPSVDDGHELTDGQPFVIDSETDEVDQPAAVDSAVDVDAQLADEVDLIDDYALDEAAPFTAAPTLLRSASLAVPAYVHDLERLGLPGALVPPYADADLFEALVARFEMLPLIPSLPRAKGTVLAVVGPRDEAMEIARELAVDVRTHPRDIVVCGTEPTEAPRRGGRSKTAAAAKAASDQPLHLATVDDAEEHRRSWRWRLEPTVVVIDSPISMADRHWARDMIAALEPHSVWGVVDGGRKVEDIAAWSDYVGGLDALAVTGVARTTTPASVLHLGLPVAMIDGEPACPELWAELLVDRIAA